MGTRDIGPFDNGTAADFGGGLDEAAVEEREAMIRGVLKLAAGLRTSWASTTASVQWPRRPWSSTSILTAIWRVRTMVHQSRYWSCLQTFECSPSTLWTK